MPLYSNDKQPNQMETGDQRRGTPQDQAIQQTTQKPEEQAHPKEQPNQETIMEVAKMIAGIWHQ